MKLQEFAPNKQSYDVYAQDPYGNGWEKEPIERGVVLTDEDGNFAGEFIKVSDDGSLIGLIGQNGKVKEWDPKELDCCIVVKGQKPKN